MTVHYLVVPMELLESFGVDLGADGITLGQYIHLFNEQGEQSCWYGLDADPCD